MVLRAGAGILPLLALPLVGTTWVFSFHLAPTYYVGMYLALVAAPLDLASVAWGAGTGAGAGPTGEQDLQLAEQLP